MPCSLWLTRIMGAWVLEVVRVRRVRECSFLVSAQRKLSRIWARGTILAPTVLSSTKCLKGTCRVNMKKIVAPIVGLVVAGLLGACTPAEVASSNLSNDSDNFRIMRRIVFVNGITDKYLLSIEGLCSIKKDNQDNQLEVTCKTGDGEYKKHFLGISDNVTYFVEQMESAQVDTYHYKVTFQPETILPDIDLQTSSSGS